MKSPFSFPERWIQIQLPAKNSSTANQGRAGEESAATYLEKKGMKILERNFRSRTGEVDIIALDGETIVSVEVKTWSSYGIDALEHSLNTKKQSKIIETTKYFLSLHREYRYMAIRFDVIFVSPGPKGLQAASKSPLANGITHIASAFAERV